MAKKSTQKKTSLEPSEVFCAVGLLMESKKMRSLVTDQTGVELLKWASSDGEQLSTKITNLDNSVKLKLCLYISLRNPVYAAHFICYPILITVERFFEFKTHWSTCKCSIAQALLDPFDNTHILSVYNVPKFN